MFLNKTFSSLSSSLFRSNDTNVNPKTSNNASKHSSTSTIPKSQNIDLQTQSLIKQLKKQNQQLKQQLNSFKQQFINAKIQYDTEIRAYEQLLDQIRGELEQKNQLYEQLLMKLRQREIGQTQIQRINEQAEQKQSEQQQQNQKNNLNKQTLVITKQISSQSSQQTPKIKQRQNQNKQISQLMIQSYFSYKQKYEQVVQQLNNLQIKYDKVVNELENIKSNQSQTKDMSFTGFTGKGQSKISFQFGDLTAQLNDIDQIAEFTHEQNYRNVGGSQIVVDQEEIYVREQRIQNLQRQNFQLKHELASKSHKLAHIFNAAFEFGGMKLLDYLQESIGLVQEREEDEKQ